MPEPVDPEPRPDTDELLREYSAAADKVHQLGVALEQATSERNAVLAALSETGLTQQQVSTMTGLTVAQLRTARHNAWLDQCR